jgi:hypothetical protein
MDEGSALDYERSGSSVKGEDIEGICKRRMKDKRLNELCIL